jgi:hypothetical protein
VTNAEGGRLKTETEDATIIAFIRPSALMEAEGVGFEPTGRRSRPTVFKTVPIDHSGTPPEERLKAKGGTLKEDPSRDPVWIGRKPWLLFSL